MLRGAFQKSKRYPVVHAAYKKGQFIKAFPRIDDKGEKVMQVDFCQIYFKKGGVNGDLWPLTLEQFEKLTGIDASSEFSGV